MTVKTTIAMTCSGDREGEAFLADSNPNDGANDRDYNNHDPAGDGDGNDSSQRQHGFD